MAHPLNERLKKLLKETKVTQNDMQSALGLSQSSVSKMLNSDIPVNSHYLGIFANILNVDKEFLRKGEGYVVEYEPKIASGDSEQSFYITVLESNIQTLNNQVEQLRQTKLGLINELKSLKDQNHRLKKTNDLVEANNERLMSQLDQLENRNNPTPARPHQSG